MPDPNSAAPAGPSRWSRRTVVLAGLTLAATSCSLSDPAVRGTRAPAAGTPEPSPTPSPLPPGLARDLAAETALAEGARARLAGTDADDGRRRDLLELMARAHTERAAALASPAPETRPASAPPADPTASPSAGPPTPRTSRLVSDERALAQRYRRAALAADGPEALLWGSMAVASGAFARALAADEPPPSADVAAHRPLTVVSDADAMAALVEALHAMVWGYQLALGKLPASGATHDRALAGLRDRRALQDRLVQQLRRTGVDVPAAAPAYDPDPEVGDGDDARLLLRRMETRLLPFCGLWLAAAARRPDRVAALEALTVTAATAVAWGAPLRAWPGWGD